MIVTCVHVYVKEEYVDNFIKACRKNHEGSVSEPGNLRFDVLQCRDEPTRFMLYEAYESEEAAKAHKETAHYMLWRDTVADWMKKPREGVPYEVLFPTERDAW